MSPDLVALLSCRASPDAVCDEQMAAGSMPSQICTPVTAGVDGTLFSQRILRRDGGFPLTLRAAVLWEQRSQIAQPVENGMRLTRDVRLFVTQEQQLVAQVVFEPQNCAARPVYGAEWIGSCEDLGAFLQRCAPKLCFAASATPSPEAAGFCAQLDPVQVLNAPREPTLQ